MKTTNSTIEASAPANVRPSSVSKTSKAVQAEFVRHCVNRRLSTETILNYLRTRLARYEIPTDIAIVADFPRTPSGKPDLGAIQRYFTDTASAAQGDHAT